MLYHVLEYDPKTKIAKTVKSSYYRDGNYYGAGWVQNMYSKSHLDQDRSYSFRLGDRVVNGSFVRGELDYKSPNP